jgi:nucleotide-binding universal stress UspA family protein
VVVVHAATAQEEEPARVVVGLDGSRQARAALASATEHAARIDAIVDAIVAYDPPQYWAEPLSEIAPSPEETRRQALDNGRRIVAEAAGPSDAVRVRAVEGSPADVLVRESVGAELLVVGSRSRNSLEGLALGSVALTCTANAPCPVMVVRPRGGGTEPAEARDALAATALAR